MILNKNMDYNLNKDYRIKLFNNTVEMLYNTNRILTEIKLGQKTFYICLTKQ